MTRKKPRTIVFVEDEPAVQRLVAFWLEDAGYDVHMAADGEAGLALIRAERPDLVVTDALMPKVTGDELVATLRDDPDLRDIPVIMATAAASPVRIKQMLEIGCRAVVSKPMDEESFLAAVEDALEV